MKQIGIVTSLVIALVAVGYAYIVPNIGKAKDEIMVRTWTELEEVEVNPKIDSNKVSLDSSLAIKKILESRTTPKKDYIEVNKSEVLQPKPLKYSRAIQFDKKIRSEPSKKP